MIKAFKRNISLLAITAVLLAGCGNNSLYQSTTAENTLVTSVEGVSFDMPTSFLNMATKITEISDSTDYGKGTYLWENSDSHYVFFNIEQVLITVSNKTTYNMKNSKDKEKQLGSQDINNAWFEADQEKLDYKTDTSNNAYKFMANVKSQVSITNTVYGDFVGVFTVVQNDDYECAMFVGVPGMSYSETSKSQREKIEHIAKSLAIHDNNETETELNTKEENNTQSVEDTNEKIYLQQGETGSFTGITNTGEPKTGFVTLQKVTEGAEAEEVIKEYLNRKDSPYSYQSAPEGYQWCIAEYKTEQSPDEVFPNFKLKSISGECLESVNGNKVSTRTMDIFCYKKESDNDYSNMYCYYLIPQNCLEYLLECGIDGGSDMNLETACYKIIRE